jgi:hypothetical protein
MINNAFASSVMVQDADRSAGNGRRMPFTDAAAMPRPGAALTILESKGIKVTFDKDSKNNNKLVDNLLKSFSDSKDNFYKAVSVTCKSWFCEDCRRIKGHTLREKLFKKAAMFKVPRLYTITINREWFDSPKDAYKYVMSKKFIARLLTKEMGIRRWVWILEAQEESGDGWPHWHILIDIADLPGAWYDKNTQTAQVESPENKDGWCYIPHFFDLQKAHRLLTKWKVGKQCKLSVRRDNFDNPEHAVLYITKYLIKTPKRGFPEWMLKTPRLKFFASSRAVSCSSEPSQRRASKRPSRKRENKQARLPVERVAECAKKVVFSIYDKAKDRFRFTQPMWGMKESIKRMTQAVCIQDFDFDTQCSFPVWGFNNMKDLSFFSSLWSNPTVLQKLTQNINNKQTKLLNQWNTA